MDGHSLDRLAIRLATRRDRRRVLGGLAGAALGLVGLGAAPARAKPSMACRQFCSDLGLTGGDAARCRQECDACGGDPARLCPTAAGPVCCADPNPTCYQGQCQCVGVGGSGPECVGGDAYTVCPAGTTCRSCHGPYEVLGPGSYFCGGGRATCCEPGTQNCAPLPFTDAAADAAGYCTYPTGG